MQFLKLFTTSFSGYPSDTASVVNPNSADSNIADLFFIYHLSYKVKNAKLQKALSCVFSALLIRS